MFGYFNGMQENKPVITTGKGNVVTGNQSGNKMTLTGYAEKLLDKVNPNIGHIFIFWSLWVPMVQSNIL